MKTYVINGWNRTVRHAGIIVLLFVYQFLWGFFLYRAIDGVLVPLLKRYPDPLAAKGAVELFLVEAQFRIMKTDLLVPYGLALAGLLAVRMLLTPFINAGLFHSLQHATKERGTTFFSGIRAAWKRIALIYAAELALILAPLAWLLPLARRAFFDSAGWGDLLWAVLPAAAAWLGWCLLIRLVSLGMQFGAAAGDGMLPSLSVTIRSLPMAAAAALTVWAIGAATGLVSTAVSMIWAGLFALILHQAQQFFRTWFKVWTFAAQYEAWQSKRQPAA
ncbi:hypothetical protein Theco_3567 [Thermobacillus composti KWC4]|uniref:Uncharacterized protein n=1 Tax=Thermobacillus composti (strain DSM 18247 / JCM 13945 / KWC4) TaxID=717605 RepID=L0EK07_THECK|nr:hypothetical protein [Thermobacillus composti]AGA59595.1 hypothetical protein Theco_3567 [Thermobacillus composti KWC4]